MEEDSRRNAKVALDQAEYNKSFDDMTERFNQVKEAYEAVQVKIDDKQSRQVEAEFFVKMIEEKDLDEFSPLLWHNLLEHVIVNNDVCMNFIFRNGAKIPIL